MPQLKKYLPKKYAQKATPSKPIATIEDETQNSKPMANTEVDTPFANLGIEENDIPTDFSTSALEEIKNPIVETEKTSEVVDKKKEEAEKKVELVLLVL